MRAFGRSFAACKNKRREKRLNLRNPPQDGANLFAQRAHLAELRRAAGHLSGVFFIRGAPSAATENLFITVRNPGTGFATVPPARVARRHSNDTNAKGKRSSIVIRILS